MPGRSVALAEGEYYHIFNRGVNKQNIFLGPRDYERICSLLNFYCYHHHSLRFSYYRRLNLQEKESYKTRMMRIDDKLVGLIAYCFMPNHFHFVLQQKKKRGISTFMSNFQNSYTRYYNTCHDRSGHLLQGRFKSVLIQSDAQLLHVTRYVHLNPYTGFLVRDAKGLIRYPWSSLLEYAHSKNGGLCEKSIVLGNFVDSNDYIQFILDHADYQQSLALIRKLILD